MLVAVVLVLVLLGVAGTVGLHMRSTDPLGQSSAQSGSVLDRVSVSGRPGATPVLTLRGPLEVTGEKYREIETGSGRTITRGSAVVLAITAFDGADATILTPDARPRIAAALAGSGEFDEVLDRAVTGRTEGSRLLFVRAVDHADSQSGSSGIEVDVVDILPSQAEGTPVELPAGAPVTVQMGDGGPVLAHGETPPTDAVTHLLIRGEGPQVRPGDRVVAQLQLTTWTQGTVRESTWETGLPRVIDLSTAMPGLVDALVDQRVGSRLVVSLPPELATGDDTLIAVVDVLGTSAGTSTDPAAPPQGDPSTTPASGGS